jgi:hypothetical protein
VEQRIVGGNRLLAARGRPDATVRVLRLHVAHGHLALHHRAVQDRLADRARVVLRGVLLVGTAAVDVEAVDRAVAVVPGAVLRQHRVVQVLREGAGRRRAVAEQRVGDGVGQQPVAVVGEVQPVDRQRGAARAGCGEEPFARCEEIDARHTLRRRDLAHRRRVAAQAHVVGGGVRDRRVEVPFVRDRREQQEPRRAAVREALPAQVVDPRAERRAERRQPRVARERLVEAVERQHHVRLHPPQPLVARAEPLRPMPRRDLVARDRQRAHDQFVLRMRRMQHRLQPPAVLEPIRERIAQDRDPITRPQFDRLRRQRNGEDADEEDGLHAHKGRSCSTEPGSNFPFLGSAAHPGRHCQVSRWSCSSCGWRAEPRCQISRALSCSPRWA